MSENRIVTIAVRNARPGDIYISKTGTGDLARIDEQRIIRVERIDWACSLHPVEVRVTVRDNSTWVPSERVFTLRPHHTIQVRKGPEPRSFMSWEPYYSDKTNRRR